MNRIKNSSLEELLELSNHEILETQVWFAIVVWKYETCKWNEAQRLASQLMKSNTAWEYLEDMRRHIGIFPKEINALPVATPPQPSKIEKRELPNTYSERMEEFNPEQIFSENYELLNMLVPELETEIQSFQPGNRLEGKSINNLYGFVTLNCNEKDKRGYYLSLGINESKSSITIMFYYDIKNEQLLTLSYEDSNGKFEVYNDMHSREMTNLSQEETLNLFVNNKLKKLIGYRLLISNLDLIANEPLEEKTEIEEEPKLPEGRFSRAMGRFIPRPVNTTDYSKMVPIESYIEDDDDFSDADEDELKEQIELQGEEIQELQEENERIKDTALKTMFSNNMKLLRVLVPNLMESMELESFTVLFKSTNEEFPVFKLHFLSVDTGFLCQLFELDPRNNVPQKLATFAVIEGKEMAFIDNSREFFGLKEPIETGIYDEYSSLTLQGNNATINWLIVLLLNQYRSSIVDPVYRAEVVEHQISEAETMDKPNDSDGVNEAGTILAILGTIGLTILGVKAFNK